MRTLNGPSFGVSAQYHRADVVCCPLLSHCNRARQWPQVKYQGSAFAVVAVAVAHTARTIVDENGQGPASNLDPFSQGMVPPVVAFLLSPAMLEHCTPLMEPLDL